MYPDNGAIVSRDDKTTLLLAVISAAICIALVRAGFLSFFFLVPLGFCAVAYGPAVAWLGLTFAILGNFALSAGISLFSRGWPASAAMDILFFTLLALGFTWIMAGNPPENRWIPRHILQAIPNIRTAFRFVIASIPAASVLVGMIFVLNSDEGYAGITRSQIEAFSNGLITSSETDAARQTILENTLTVDRVFDLLIAFVLRGGALVTAFFLFFFNRQAALVLARLFKRKKMAGDLTGFHVPQKTIWVFTLCLPVILAGRLLSLSVVEIAAWNVLVICVIMYLAQGGGIVLFLLAHRAIPAIFRLLFFVLFIVVVISSGPNALVLLSGALILLGIVENWLPMRIKNKDPVA
jgi:hypothetical protein